MKIATEHFTDVTQAFGTYGDDVVMGCWTMSNGHGGRQGSDNCQRSEKEQLFMTFRLCRCFCILSLYKIKVSDGAV